MMFSSIHYVLLLFTLSVGYATLPASALNVELQRSPAKSSANIIPGEPQFFTEYGSQRVKVRYGPYTVPPSTKNRGMKVWIDKDAMQPCSNCLVNWFKAGAEYEDGSPASTASGLWLHHLVSTFLNKPSLTCKDGLGDFFFSTGNEKSAFDLTLNGTNKAGYYFNHNDKMTTILEFMNMLSTPQTAYLTMTYEFLPGIPKGFAKALPLWLDISNCAANRERPLAVVTGASEYRSSVWTSNKNYRIIGNVGHLHDGGINLRTMKNGKVICDTKAQYEEEPEVGSSAHASHGMMKTEHISSMQQCPNQGYAVPGDKLSVIANYNVSLHHPMMNADGSIEEIMGISWMWLVEDDDVPLSDRLRYNAALAIKNAKKNRLTWLGASAFIVFVALFSFWVGRRTRRRGAGAEEKGQTSYPLGSVSSTYRD